MRQINYSPSLQIQFNEKIPQFINSNVTIALSLDYLIWDRDFFQTAFKGYTNKYYPNRLEINQQYNNSLSKRDVNYVMIEGEKFSDFYVIYFEMDDNSSIEFLSDKILLSTGPYEATDLKINSELIKIIIYQGDGLVRLGDHSFDVRKTDTLDIELLSNNSLVGIENTKMIFEGDAKSAKLNNQNIIISNLRYWFNFRPEIFTAFATLFLVISTVALVFATIQLSRITEKMWIAQDKPWLYFYKVLHDSKSTKFGSIRPYISLYVKNVGRGAAKIIEFKADQVNIKIEALSPEEESYIGDIDLKLDQEFSSIEIKIANITYKDLNDCEYQQKNVTLSTTQP